MRLLLQLLTLCLVSIAWGACTGPEPEPSPDLSATVTALVQEQLADLPSDTPHPTHTPAPTFTPYTTLTPVPTEAPYPTFTSSSTHALVPTNTPYPTATPLPTYTPYPTPTSTPMPWWASPSRTIRVKDLETSSPQFWADGQPLVLVGCAVDHFASISNGDLVTSTFSGNGQTGAGVYLASVTGLEFKPLPKTCHEM